MKYKDEIKIGIMTACFCCAMVMVYAVVPKDASVLRARATSTFKEAPETAAEAEAEKRRMPDLRSIPRTAIMTTIPLMIPEFLTHPPLMQIPPRMMMEVLMFPMMITLLRMITSTKTITPVITILPIRSLIRPMTDPTLLMMTAVPMMSRPIMTPVVPILRMIPPARLRRILSRKKLIIKSPIFYEEKATDMSCFMSAAFFFTEERFRQKIFTRLFFHLLSA